MSVASCSTPARWSRSAAADVYHRISVATFARLDPPLLTCWPVLTEAAWMLRRQPRPLDRIAEAHAAGVIEILDLKGDCLADVAAIMRRYEAARIQLADATLAHLAEREGLLTVFTFDRRDFSIIRIGLDRALKIIPDPD